MLENTTETMGSHLWLGALCWRLHSSDHEARRVTTCSRSAGSPPFRRSSTRDDGAGVPCDQAAPQDAGTTATSVAKDSTAMLIRLAHGIRRLIRASCHRLQPRVSAWTRPPHSRLVRGFAVDVARGTAELVAEHALVRQQLVVLS